jgi:hypothetical protein
MEVQSIQVIWVGRQSLFCVRKYLLKFNTI